MADRKISQLPASTAGDVVDASLLHLVNTAQGNVDDQNQKLSLSLAKAYFSEDSVQQTSATGAALLPVGDDTERPSPSTGMLRFNTDQVSFEGYDGSAWGAIGGSVAGDDAQIILATQVFG